jgi:hypothetical protein
MHRHRGDEKDENRGVGERLVGDAVNDRPERHHEAEDDEDLPERIELARRRPPGKRGHRARQQDVNREDER